MFGRLDSVCEFRSISMLNIKPWFFAGVVDWDVVEAFVADVFVVDVFGVGGV